MRKFLLALCLTHLLHAVIPQLNGNDFYWRRWSRFRSNESGVLLLDKANIYNAIDEHQPILVLFYASWCMYSRALHMEFDKVAREMRRLGVRIRLAKVDADRERAVLDPFQIEGFPTIKLFLEGINVSAIRYYGNRDARSIIKWLREWIKF